MLHFFWVRELTNPNLLLTSCVTLANWLVSLGQCFWSVAWGRGGKAGLLCEHRRMKQGGARGWGR